MKTSLTALLLVLAASGATGCAHYANADIVEESCWQDGDTVVSSRESAEGTHHVVVERTRGTDGPCDDSWREHLVYDRFGTLQQRKLDRIRCGVVEHSWFASLDGDTRTWSVAQAFDRDHDDQPEEFVEYDLAVADIDMGRLGRADSCPVMARLPVEVPAGSALVALGR